MIIDRDSVKNAYAKTGLKPVLFPAYRESEKSANPLGVLLVAAGEPVENLYDYFGSEFVTSFHHGLNSNSEAYALDKNAYDQGAEYRLAILDGSVCEKK